MKKFILSILIIAFTVSANEVNAQDSPNFAKLDASPMDMTIYRNNNDEAIARVIYSRPQKRNREIFGKLIPYGEVWRTGANEATEITFYQDMQVAGATIDAGTYSLFTIPGEKEWTIILNNNINTWGAYEYKEVQDVARITVPVRQSSTSIEALSMAFEKASNGMNLLIGWDDKYVKVPFKDAD